MNERQAMFSSSFRAPRSSCLFAALLILALLLSGCGRSPSSTESRAVALPPPPPPAAPLPSDEEVTLATIRFLEDRVRRDPEDLVAYNKLAAYYLQLNRETGDVKYLELASRAARASLSVLPADQNLGGLISLAQTEYAAHDFEAARDHARELIEYQPRKSSGYQLLGDALLELGDYDGATAAFERMRQFGGSTVTTETRLARLAMLYGETEEAARRYRLALNLALDMTPVSRETVAWCRWQLGETAFATGDYKTAEQHYRDALVTFPDYHRARFSLGRVRAAQGDRAGAIEETERAVRRLPDPVYVAALGDLYRLAGREREAAAQYELVERIARLSELNGTLYNRQLALFHADHELKTEDAYASAKKEYAARRDIYGADALAWTALKAGKIDEAQAVIKDVLRLGTRDARIFYHAGMIARAAGDNVAARDYLQRALKLNPQFDPLQAAIASKALAE
ncbi:MAG TPA: tetratricopeptide repeat protein [Pyrinomonadaceae bacterium]|nr:tetratricopeptide repeat protein [Pyrinomonadaceae bacterium]